MNKGDLSGKILLKIFLVLFCPLAFMIPGCKSFTDKQSEKSEILNIPSRDQSLDWFREAKFGMFIHWGPYSQLGGEWKGQRQAESQAEWIMKYMKIPATEYRELAHKMNPVRFNAKEWVQLAKETGMKYIVITAKHHDGFAMYRSKVSGYNIADWTPFSRDPLKELAEACEAEGIKFGVYYSHREDWDHPGGYGNNWDYDNDWGENLFPEKKFNEYLEEKAKPQLRELLTNYGPVALVWFDRGLYTPEQGMEFVRLVNDLQPACLINSRVGHYGQELLGDYQSMADNGMPPGGLGEYWESAQTLNHTWGFNKSDTLWKSPETVIQRLVEIVSRGGNYLLNIGPTGEGEIPKATVDIFNKVGPWVLRNAESIYGAGANPFPELSWGYTTVKGNHLYLFVRGWPEDRKLSLPGLKNEIRSAYFLIDKSVKLPVRQSGNLTYLDLPVDPPDNPVSVIALEFEGSLSVDNPVVEQDKNGRIELNYLTVKTYGKTKTRFNRKGNFHISKWTGPEDYAEWKASIANPGKFKLSVTYSANKDMQGQPFDITIGDSNIRSKVITTGEWFEFSEFPVGYTELNKAGNYTITIRPRLKSNNYLMYLRSVTLTPVPDVKKEGWGSSD
jgi:alpha-L-fucosidase